MILDNSQPTVANFVQKSFEIISNSENNHIVEWLQSGKQFIIKDTELFQSVILPHYFRHRNINSFIRQLNMYGFHKSRKQPTKNIFSHPNFLKGKPEILINVRRKLKDDKIDQNMPQMKKSKTEVIISANQIQKPKEIKVELPSSKEVLKTKQSIEFNFEKKLIELEKTAIKQQPLISLCSIENLQDLINQSTNNQKSFDWPFRSLIQKSQIMELNPQVYNMKYQNITSLHHIDEIEFDFYDQNEKKIEMEQIDKEKKRLNSRMVGYNILQTINFMNDFQF